MRPRYLVQPSQSHLARRRWLIRIAVLGFAVLTLLGVCASSLAPAGKNALPFSVGEKLTYEVRVAKGGTLRGSSLRFFKHEQNPLTRHDESVDFYPDQKEWKAVNKEAGQSPSNTPLDEPSFMYFIRTLPMTPGTMYSFDRYPRRYKGEGIIRIHLTDDDCRLPARIESTMPVVGTAILSIDSQNTRCKKP